MSTRARRRTDRLALAAAVLLVACGGALHNSASESFVARMIPHHHLGMMLIEDARLRSDGVELRRMVFEMGAYHSDELAELSRWAGEWKVSEAADFPGMIPAGQLARLGSLDGPAHDTWWLHLMIDHHRGALVIAEDAVKAADNSRVVSMARSVISVQERQITEMQALLLRFCRGNPSLPGC